MLKMEKPCTAMARTSRLLLLGRATSIFEKSKDVLTQTIRLLLFPLEGGPVFANYMIVWDGRLVLRCQMRLLDAEDIR